MQRPAFIYVHKLKLIYVFSSWFSVRVQGAGVVGAEGAVERRLEVDGAHLAGNCA